MTASDGRAVDSRPRIPVDPVDAPLEGTWRATPDDLLVVDATGMTWRGYRPRPPVDPPWDQRVPVPVRRLLTGRGVTATATGLLLLASPDTAMWVGPESLTLLVRDSPTRAAAER